MDIGQEILSLLDTQKGHYTTLKQAVERQTDHIKTVDIGGLTAGTSEVRRTMRKIRDLEVALRPLRQSWATMGADRPSFERQEIDTQVVDIRELITRIQAVKDENAELLKQSMFKTRKQMADLNTQGKAARAYHSRPAQPARFVDKSN